MTDFHLASILSQDKMKHRSTRDGFGEAMLELGAKEKRIWALTADLRESMRLREFARQYPSQFIECGVAEQNMMGLAAGLALADKIPFVSSFAVFSPGRNWDQLRVSVCYSRANVKVVGGHAGLATGGDGATHQALEDIALTRVLPHMAVLVPCDVNQARAATIAAAKHQGPVYLRLGREPAPELTHSETPFEIGKAQIFSHGNDVTLIATGPILYEALLASEMLENMQVSAEVINLHTIKPIDSEAIVKTAKKTRCIVTCEDHQVAGGMGSAVAEVLAERLPTHMEMVGVHDAFGQSGTAKELWNHYGLSAHHIVQGVLKVITRKKKGL